MSLKQEPSDDIIKSVIASYEAIFDTHVAVLSMIASLLLAMTRGACYLLLTQLRKVFVKQRYSFYAFVVVKDVVFLVWRVQRIAVEAKTHQYGFQA